VEPAALLPRGREHLTQRVPEPQRSVTDGQDRGAHAAPGAVAQQVRPRPGRLPVTLGERDEFLTAVHAYPDQHEQARLYLVEAHVEVHAVGPEVDVVGGRQVPVAERAGLVLPLHGEPGDRGSGQARAGAEELLQRRHEVL
jgi:hypothetical protein